jgi:hypothetical protein
MTMPYMPWDDKPEPKPDEEPNYLLWGVAAIGPFFWLILWAATSTGVMLQTIFGLVCLAIASGYWQIVELHTPKMPDDPEGQK